MSVVLAPKMQRLVHKLGKHIYWEFGRRDKFSTDEYVQRIYQELGKEDLNHAEFRWDIARTFVRADLAERSKHDPFKVTAEGRLDVAGFDPRDFAKGNIRLGDGMNVGMVSATGRQWIARSFHQQKAAEAAQQAATRTTMFLQSEPGVLLMEDPRLKTADAMFQLKLWDPDDMHETDDDTTDDDE